MSPNKLEMVKCEKFTNKYVPNKHTEKSVVFDHLIQFNKFRLFLHFVGLFSLNCITVFTVFPF